MFRIFACDLGFATVVVSWHFAREDVQHRASVSGGVSACCCLLLISRSANYVNSFISNTNIESNFPYTSTAWTNTTAVSPVSLAQVRRRECLTFVNPRRRECVTHVNYRCGILDM